MFVKTRASLDDLDPHRNTWYFKNQSRFNLRPVRPRALTELPIGDEVYDSLIKNPPSQSMLYEPDADFARLTLVPDASTLTHDEGPTSSPKAKAGVLNVFFDSHPEGCESTSISHPLNCYVEACRHAPSGRDGCNLSPYLTLYSNQAS